MNVMDAEQQIRAYIVENFLLGEGDGLHSSQSLLESGSEIGKAMIDLFPNRPGGFTGEIMVIEDEHRSDPYTNSNSGWCTTNKLSNSPCQSAAQVGLGWTM